MHAPTSAIRYLTPSTGISAVSLALPEAEAFNGAIADTPEGRLLVYRTGQNKPSLASCLLEADMRVVAGSQKRLHLCRNVDPRLIWLDGALHMTTSYHGPSYRSERMELRRLKFADGRIAGWDDLGKFETILGDPAYVRVREKNWAPFVHDGELHFVQQFQPHRVLRYVGGELAGC